jgi:hypothetical protein
MEFARIINYTVIIILILIICFILFVFLPRPGGFSEVMFDLSPINDNFSEIKKEINDNKDSLPVIPIYGNKKIYDLRFKTLYNCLNSIKGVQYTYIGIINLKPKFGMKKNKGYSNNANIITRYFLCIDESGTKKSGIWIDGEKKFFSKSKWICADISREHSLFNRSKYDNSVILFVDIVFRERIGSSDNDKIEKDEILKIFNLKKPIE